MAGSSIRAGAALALCAAAAALLALAPGAGAAPRDSRLAGVHSWAFAIGNHTLDGGAAGVGARYAGYDLVVTDGEEATPAEIAALHADGAIVLAYLSVGTIEKWRSWFPELKRYRLEAWKDWKDEWFAKVRSRRYRNAVAGKVAPALLDKGFDGLFLDNTDMIENHHGQAKGMRTLVRSLSGLVRSRGKLLFAQNGYDVISPLIPYLDGWNREDVTWTWDFDHHRYMHQRPGEVSGALGELGSLAADGLLVTATDYVAAGDAGAAAEAVSNACSAGALPYVSDIGLRRVPDAPLICP